MLSSSCSALHQKCTCWEDSLYKFHLSAADIHLITVDWDPHYVREQRAKAGACMCVFMHVNKDKR